MSVEPRTSADLVELLQWRDQLILNLWETFHKMNMLECTKWTGEDINLWNRIERHSSMKERIKQFNDGEEPPC